MKYLALDQALRCTGFAIFDNEKLLAWGTYETNPTQPIDVRLWSIYKQIEQLSLEYNIEHIFFEDVQYQNNQQTYRQLCYVQVMIMVYCYKNKIPYTILSPSHWRKILKDKYKIVFGRKREEQKKAALNWVKENYNPGKSNFNSDSADAICLGVAGMLEYKNNESAW